MNAVLRVLLCMLLSAGAFNQPSTISTYRPSTLVSSSPPGSSSHESVLWTPSIKSGARDLEFGPLSSYCASTSQVVRRKSRTVTAGAVKFGSEHRIVRQTMATTDTADVAASVDQIIRCADKGFDLVRITVQGKREASAAMKIRESLNQKGYSDTALCADMHFQPKVALIVADAVEKIRINPGNFADGRKDFEDHVYETEEDYIKERAYLYEAMLPLVEKCKKLNRAMRIGTNHGSLSSRTLSFYGDTPRGMVESAIEFADICRQEDYHNFVFSMKASNPLVMVQGYRLLSAEMDRLNWDYPLHLGVTEAGEGEDGRMKSAIGIGTLLADGLGDTVRVSLTEDPEFEYEPCNRLAEIAQNRLASSGEEAKMKQLSVPKYVDTRDVFQYGKREVQLPEQLTTDESFDARGILHRDGSVISMISNLDSLSKANAPYLYQQLGCKTAVGMPFKDIATVDSIFLSSLPSPDDSEKLLSLKRLQEINMGVIVPAGVLNSQPLENAVALMSLTEAIATGGKLPPKAIRLAIEINGSETDADLLHLSKLNPVMIFNDPAKNLSHLHASRRLFEFLKREGLKIPVIHHFRSSVVDDSNELSLQMGMRCGSQLTDGLGDGVMVELTNEKYDRSVFSIDFQRRIMFSLLQGCRMRSTKTEFVSCPSCGRTLFDLQTTTAKITEATGHLPGVTVAVMGCIVNGPGEMADADFGYVGTLPGKVDLYVGKEVVKKSILNENAVAELVELIKEGGMWVEKEEEEKTLELA